MAVSTGLRLDLVLLHGGQTFFSSVVFMKHQMLLRGNVPSSEKCCMQIHEPLPVSDQPELHLRGREFLAIIFACHLHQKPGSVTNKNQYDCGKGCECQGFGVVFFFFFWHKLLICMCSGEGGKIKGAMDFSVWIYLPSNSFISSS